MPSGAPRPVLWLGVLWPERLMGTTPQRHGLCRDALRPLRDRVVGDDRSSAGGRVHAQKGGLLAMRIHVRGEALLRLCGRAKGHRLPGSGFAGNPHGRDTREGQVPRRFGACSRR